MKKAVSDTRHAVSLGIPKGETFTVKKKEMGAVAEEESHHTTEFRSYNDDAWYSVWITKEEAKQTLRIRYLDFSEEQDNLFEPTDLRSSKELQEFKERFRPLSKQVQDNECSQLVKGVRVCACNRFQHDDVRFYDALVDGVQKSKHSCKTTEELCLCTFILFWLHGPNAGNLTATTVENICIVQPALDLDPVVDSFLKMARERIECMSSQSISTSKGVSGLEMVANCNGGSKIARRLGFFERIQKEKRRARRSGFEVCSPEVGCHDRRMEDSELKGRKNVCMILMGNLDRDLCPSTVVEFLHRHTSVSTTVFIFPSLSTENFTRGTIMLDSEKEFQKLCDFLINPNYIITSSTGRPWVIIEKLVGLKKIKASIGTLLPISKNVLQNGKNRTGNNLKVVFSGTQEFKIASDLRNLFLEFSDHQERLHKRLAFEEKDICSQNVLQNGTSNNLKVVFSGAQEFKIAGDLRNLFLEFSDHQERVHKRLALEEEDICSQVLHELV